MLSLTAAFGATGAGAHPLNLERGAVPEDCGACFAGPGQAQFLGSQAVAPLEQGTAPQQPGQQPGDKPATKPHLEIGSEDDTVIANAFPGLIDTSAQEARLMGAGVERVIVYPKAVFGHKLKQDDAAVKSATDKGMSVYMTLAGNGVHWADRKFERYVTTTVKHYDKLGVRFYGLINEPNFGSWLYPMPGKTRAQTYRELYVDDGYPAVKSQAKKDGVDDKVAAFETSSERQPLQFMKAVLACTPSGSVSCAPLITDMVAYHPYTLTSSPNKPCDPSGDIGFACLPLIDNLIQAEYDAGKLQTPDGQKPDLGFTEFAYEVQSGSASGTRAHGRYILDRTRSLFYQRDLQLACDDPNVKMLVFYGRESSPALQSKNEPKQWNSALIRPNGKPDKSYDTIQSFSADHPECVVR